MKTNKPRATQRATGSLWKLGSASQPAIFSLSAFTAGVFWELRERACEDSILLAGLAPADFE